MWKYVNPYNCQEVQSDIMWENASPSGFTVPYHFSISLPCDFAFGHSAGTSFGTFTGLSNNHLASLECLDVTILYKDIILCILGGNGFVAASFINCSIYFKSHTGKFPSNNFLSIFYLLMNKIFWKWSVPL